MLKCFYQKLKNISDNQCRIKTAKIKTAKIKIAKIKIAKIKTAKIKSIQLIVPEKREASESESPSDDILDRLLGVSLPSAVDTEEQMMHLLNCLSISISQRSNINGRLSLKNK